MGVSGVVDAATESAPLPSGPTITEFEIPTPNARPMGIAVGGDKNLWFTEAGAGKIGRITPGGDITEYPLPDRASEPTGIAADTQGNLWFTETTAGKIGRISTAGVLQEFTIAEKVRPFEITLGSDGNMYFITGGSSPWRVTPTGGVLFGNISTVSALRGITRGPDGLLWMTTGPLPRLARTENTFGVYSDLPANVAGLNSGFAGITTGPDQNIWFVATEANLVVRYTLDHVVRAFPLPTPQSGPVQIAAGPDGNVWFTESRAHKVGRITPAGGIAEYALPGGATPHSLVAGPDGKIWFCESGTNRIGRLAP